MPFDIRRWTASLRAAQFGILALLALVFLAGAWLPPAATASTASTTITINLTANGPQPANATAAVGDVVRFYNADATFPHQVKSSSPNWSFNSGALPPGQSFTTDKLARPGQYDYVGANLDSFNGKVVVPGVPPPSRAPSPAPTAPQPPARTPTPAPAAGATGGPSPGAAAAPPGAGVAPAPPLAGGFGPLPLSGPTPGASDAGPNVAAPLGDGSTATASPTSGAAVAIGAGPLPEPPTGRRYGLPAVLAAVAAAGVASLLVRFLLAQPAARPAGQDRRPPRGQEQAIPAD